MSRKPPANKRHHFTPESISAFVCRLSGGRSLAAVCRDPDMPSRCAVNARMRIDPAFKALVEAVRHSESRGGAPGGARRSMWSPALADAILEALRAGFSLSEICRSPACPVSRKGVERWLAVRPEFAAAYRAACAPRVTARGLVIGRGRRGGYDPQFAHLLADRLIEGRSLSSIGTDPDMPGPATLARWARRHPDFRLAMDRARRAQLDVLLDVVIENPDVPHRRNPAIRLIAAGWRHGYRPYGALPIELGTARWAQTVADGARRTRRNAPAARQANRQARQARQGTPAARR